MSRIIAFLLVVPFFACGQEHESSQNQSVQKVYVQALGDFIKAANAKNGSAFDTLFVANRKNGQEDDFPAIELPANLENTVIKLISPEEGKKSQNARKARIYLNMIGWVESDKAEFLIYVFSNGFEHQYNYTLNYKGHSGKFELDKLEFKGPPF